VDEITPLMDWAHALAGDPALDGVDYASLALVVLLDTPDPVVYGFWYTREGAPRRWQPADTAVLVDHAHKTRDVMVAGGRRPWGGCVLRLTLPHWSVAAAWLYGEQVAEWDVPADEVMTRAAPARP